MSYEAPAHEAPASLGGATCPRARPSWSGLLRLSLVVVPVKAYPATTTSSGIHFNQLHANCGQRVKYEKHCPVHGAVEAAEIVRGYQYAPDQYVVVEPEELDKIRPAKDKALVLEKYVAAHQVDPAQYQGRSLYLLPDGVAARHPYGVVAEALQQGGRWAIGRVVLSGTRQLVSVRPMGRLLVMDLLLYPAEVRAAATWESELPAAVGTPEEVQLALTIIDGAGPVAWPDYRDATAEELTALIEAKIAGRALAAPLTEEPAAVLQLLDALKQSVAAVQEKPPAAKAKTKKPQTPRRPTG